MVQRHATSPVNVVFTPDIATWAISNRIGVEGNPIATSIPQIAEIPRRIVLKEPITENEFLGAIGRLEISGEWAVGSRMRREPKLFFTHLALHELAHLENNWPQENENECDAWAIARLED